MGNATSRFNAAALNQVPDQKQQAAVAAKVSRFRDAGPVRLTFCSRTPNPYVSAYDALIDIYVDDYGHEYWHDPAADRLVQVGPQSGHHQKTLQVEPADRLPVPQLREIAVNLAARAIPDFFDRREYLHPLEDNHKKQLYFFRWDDFTQPVGEMEIPPFLQVALHPNGQLASFTNTLN